MPEESNPTEHSPSPVDDVAGIVLAGGKSSRYGRNKAFVELEGVRLIERVIGVLRPIFRHVHIMTNTPWEYAYLDLPMHEDIVKGLGPLGGIHTALHVISEPAGFFAACDMPYLSGPLIRHMAGQRCGFDAVVPRISGLIETLHSVYGKGCLPAIRRLIDSGMCQVFRFFPDVSIRYVEEDEVRRYDPELDSFFNVNKPGDLASTLTKKRLDGPS